MGEARWAGGNLSLPALPLVRGTEGRAPEDAVGTGCFPPPERASRDERPTGLTRAPTLLALTGVAR